MTNQKKTLQEIQEFVLNNVTGSPLTLVRILKAIQKNIMIHSNIFKGNLGFTCEFGVFYWDLMGEYFEDQTEKTRRIIDKILEKGGNKDE